MATDDRHEEYLRYSFKELMAEVATKIDRLTTSLEATKGDLDRRVSALERGVPLGQDLVRRFLTVEGQSQATDRRLSVLEATQTELSRDSIRTAETRRWLIGLTVGTLVGLGGTAVGIITLIIHSH